MWSMEETLLQNAATTGMEDNNQNELAMGGSAPGMN